jgi:hypothetical protein
MEEHDEFELAIEMRKHGALAIAAADALEAHLTGCAACRGYAELADQSDARLASLATTAAAKINWTEHRAQIERLRRASDARDLAPLVLSLVALGLLATLGFGWQPYLLIAETCAAAVVVPCVVLFSRARLACAERIDPFAFYRQRLRAKLWREALLVAFFSLLSLFTYWLSGPHHVGRAYRVDFWPSHAWRHLRLADVLLLATSAASWWAAMRVLFVRIPATRRERDDLR